MTIRNLIEIDASLSIFDPFDVEFGEIFDGPLFLTDKGLVHFAPVLDFNVELDVDDNVAFLKLKASRMYLTEYDRKHSTEYDRCLIEIEYFFECARKRHLKKYKKWFVN